MEPTKARTELGGDAPSGPPEDPTSETARSHWSPLHTHGARLSWGLLAVFSAFYFVVAILTSAEFADLAATSIFGLPLGFILGMVLIIAGLVITRVYLARGEG